MVNPDTGRVPAVGRLWAHWFACTAGGQYAGMVAGYFGGFALLSLTFSSVPGLPEFASGDAPSLFDPITALLVVGIGSASAIYGFLTGLIQRFALPIPGASWLVTTTLASAGTAILGILLLLGWITITAAATGFLGTVVNQFGLVTLGTLGGLAYGYLTSLPLRPFLADRRPWIMATTISAAVSSLVIAYLSFTSLPLVAIALLVRPLVDAAITATGLSSAVED